MRAVNSCIKFYIVLLSVHAFKWMMITFFFIWYWPLNFSGGFVPFARHQSNQGMSIWDYIEKHHRKTTLFMNFLYSPTDEDAVLRPYSNISNLRIWDYYLLEDLAHGPAYEIETTNKEIQISEEEKTDSSGQPLLRKIVNGCYDNVLLQQPNAFRLMLQVCNCRV